MRAKLAHRLMFAILLIYQLPVCLATETSNANKGSKYLNAVRTVYTIGRASKEEGIGSS